MNDCRYGECVVVTRERPWGEWIRLYCDVSTELRRLHIRKGGFSSIHKHTTKSNHFWVVSGEVEIRFFNDDGTMRTGTRHLDGSGIPASILSGVVHQFYGTDNAIAYEFSIVERENEMDPDEITRLTEAGCDCTPDSNVD